MITYHLPMFSQSWDSPSPDLQVTPSPPSPSKKNRSPMLGLRWANIFDSHGMEMEKWKIYRKTSPENGRFNRIWAVNMRSVCHPKTTIWGKRCDVQRGWYFLDGTTCCLVGLSEKKTPGFGDVLPKPSGWGWGWGDKSHDFSETRGTTKQIWLLSLKVMICPSSGFVWK